MKKNRRITIIALVLVLLVLCAGCDNVLQNMENSRLRSTTEAMLDALVAEDHQGAYKLVSHICSQEEFQTAYAQMRQVLGDVKAYELQLLYISSDTNITNGQKTSTVSSIYKITTSNGMVVANVRMDDRMGLTAFYLTPYEMTDYFFTGTLGHMRDADAVQWILLLLNGVPVGLGVYALVDCARKKIKNKALWIIILVIGFATVGATVTGTSFRMNFNLGWLTAYSALIRYGSGAVTLRLMLPVGGIVYFCMRRSLLRAPKNAPTPDGQAVTQEQPEGEK